MRDGGREETSERRKESVGGDRFCCRCKEGMELCDVLIGFIVDCIESVMNREW